MMKSGYFLPPKNNLKQGKFIIPKLVPGFYQAMNFGQYVSDFTATDKNGKKIVTERLDKTAGWYMISIV